jgi:hypothetical protein
MEALSNPKFTKTFRTTVQMFRDTTAGTNVFGRYYFNEIRELYGKNIVGFNVDPGEFNNFYPYSIPNPDYTTFVNNNGLYMADLQIPLKNLFINIYNNQDELIIDNFPAAAATNYNTTTFGVMSIFNKKNIIPLDCKIDIRKSYIFGNISLLGVDNLAVSINFYYN